MITQVPKGVLDQIAYAFTNTDLTTGQIEQKVGVSQNTVRSIGKEIYGDNLKSEMNRRNALLREQISELKLQKLTCKQICRQLGLSRAYYYKIMSGRRNAGAGADCSIAQVPALEHDAQGDDEQEVNIISISGTPIESAPPKPKLPALKIKAAPKALKQREMAAASALPSEVGIKVGAAELKFNLDELNPQRIETLCLLIKRLGKGDAR